MSKKKYFDNEELNRRFVGWLNNTSAGAPHPLDLEKFVSFSIKAIELDEYDITSILRSLEAHNSHAKYNDRILCAYENYYHAIKTTYNELMQQGNVDKDEIIKVLKR